MIFYLIILAALALIFALGLFLGDTDGHAETQNPKQIKSHMRGLKPDVRLLTAFMLLSHSFVNPFVEGLVVAGVNNKRARTGGKFLAVLAMASLLFGFWLLTG